MIKDLDFLKRLDAAAYSHPEIMPPEIMRNDRAKYRIYFRHMAALYLLYENGVFELDTLRDMKNAFMRDFNNSRMSSSEGRGKS